MEPQSAQTISSLSNTLRAGALKTLSGEVASQSTKLLQQGTSEQDDKQRLLAAAAKLGIYPAGLPQNPDAQQDLKQLTDAIQKYESQSPSAQHALEESLQPANATNGAPGASATLSPPKPGDLAKLAQCLENVMECFASYVRASAHRPLPGDEEVLRLLSRRDEEPSVADILQARRDAEVS
jgi:hypothetical protein